MSFYIFIAAFLLLGGVAFFVWKQERRKKAERELKFFETLKNLYRKPDELFALWEARVSSYSQVTFGFNACDIYSDTWEVEMLRIGRSDEVLHDHLIDVVSLYRDGYAQYAARLAARSRRMAQERAAIEKMFDAVAEMVARGEDAGELYKETMRRADAFLEKDPSNDLL